MLMRFQYFPLIFTVVLTLNACSSAKTLKRPGDQALQSVTLTALPPERRTLIRHKIQPAIARNTALTLNELNTTPIMENHQLVGHRIRNLPNVNLFSYLSLNIGDILVSANRARIQSPKELVLFIRDLDKKGRGELTLIRAQQLWTYRYIVKD